jgi:hypothetical protein
VLAEAGVPKNPVDHLDEHALIGMTERRFSMLLRDECVRITQICAPPPATPSINELRQADRERPRHHSPVASGDRVGVCGQFLMAVALAENIIRAAHAAWRYS